MSAPALIASSVEVLYLVASGGLPFWKFMGRYLAPTLLGNTIGGVSLVAALNHAQVVAGKERQATERQGTVRERDGLL